jgi:hypothetical protein
MGASDTPQLAACVAGVFQSRSRLARGARRALSTTVALSVLALVVFHAALFWHQLGDGRLLDPAVAARWGLGGLLLVALGALRRAGVPLLWGRRALVVWVLVALLHWTTVPAVSAGTLERGGAMALLFFELPASAALLTASLFLLFLLRARLAPRTARLMGRSVPTAPVGHAPILSRHLASRAPPPVIA